MKILLLSFREWTQMHRKRMKTMTSKMLKVIKKMLEFLNIAKHFDLQQWKLCLSSHAAGFSHYQCD